MIASILLLLKPFLPYVIAGLAALIGGGTFIWNTKRKAKAEGVAQQLAKEAEARAQEIERIKDAAGARPVGGVSDDPNNRDNTRP